MIIEGGSKVKAFNVYNLFSNNVLSCFFKNSICNLGINYGKIHRFTMKKIYCKMKRNYNNFNNNQGTTIIINNYFDINPVVANNSCVLNIDVASKVIALKVLQ